MVVDDEPDMRMALRLFLERYSHEVTEAGDGEQALSLLNGSGNFDAVLLDLRMPGLDGQQTLVRIRQTHKELPVIMVTGYGSMESAAEVLEKGANCYVSKPFKHEELREALVKVGLPGEPIAGGSANERTGLFSDPWIRFLGAGLALGLITLGWLWHQGWLTRRDYKLPYSNPIDMAYQDGKLYIADWMTQSIYIHDARRRELPVVKTYFLPDVHLSGMAVCGDTLFVSDSWAKQIQRRRLNDSCKLEDTTPSPGSSPSSLFCDGKYLWSVDAQAGKIYQQRLDERLTVVAEFRSPGKSPVGFYKDEKYAWSSDSQTRRLYRLRLDDQLTPIASFSLEDLEQRQEPLSCFRWVGSDLWFARDRLGVVFRRDVHWLRKL
jgi:CheY-like chemotaxis protein